MLTLRHDIAAGPLSAAGFAHAVPLAQLMQDGDGFHVAHASVPGIILEHQSSQLGPVFLQSGMP